MNEKQYKKQKERRFKEQMKRFKEFGVLTDDDLLKLVNKEAWVMGYLKEHTYITLNNLTGDFMLDEWNISLVGRSYTPSNDLKKLLVYSFRPIIQKLSKEGVLLKYNSKTYKVVK